MRKYLTLVPALCLGLAFAPAADAQAVVTPNPRHGQPGHVHTPGDQFRGRFPGGFNRGFFPGRFFAPRVYVPPVVGIPMQVPVYSANVGAAFAPQFAPSNCGYGGGIQTAAGLSYAQSNVFMSQQFAPQFAPSYGYGGGFGGGAGFGLGFGNGGGVLPFAADLTSGILRGVLGRRNGRLFR